MKYLTLFESDDKLIRAERKEKMERLSNPLNRKTKQNARRYIYKISSKIIEGIFKDEYWTPVTQLLKKWDKEGVDWDYYKPAQYFNFPMTDSMNLPYKQWYITISFYNDRGKLNDLSGILTAHFNGTEKDPLQMYDLTLVL